MNARPLVAQLRATLLALMIGTALGLIVIVSGGYTWQARQDARIAVLQQEIARRAVILQRHDELMRKSHEVTEARRRLDHEREGRGHFEPRLFILDYSFPHDSAPRGRASRPWELPGALTYRIAWIDQAERCLAKARDLEQQAAVTERQIQIVDRELANLELERRRRQPAPR